MGSTYISTRPGRPARQGRPGRQSREGREGPADPEGREGLGSGQASRPRSAMRCERAGSGPE